MHKLFCVFGDFYVSGTQDSEVTKSLIGSLEFFFANGHNLDACLCFVVVEQEKSIAKCLLVYVENQTNSVKQNLFEWEKLGHCERVRWAYLPLRITSQYAGLATSCPVTEPFIVKGTIKWNIVLIWRRTRLLKNWYYIVKKVLLALFFVINL